MDASKIDDVRPRSPKSAPCDAGAVVCLGMRIHRNKGYGVTLHRTGMFMQRRRRAVSERRPGHSSLQAKLNATRVLFLKYFISRKLYGDSKPWPSWLQTAPDAPPAQTVYVKRQFRLLYFVWNGIVPHRGDGQTSLSSTIERRELSDRPKIVRAFADAHAATPALVFLHFAISSYLFFDHDHDSVYTVEAQHDSSMFILIVTHAVTPPTTRPLSTPLRARARYTFNIYYYRNHRRYVK
ncbi:hypothetical protein EVAR_50554_1 [Eumeta japonica]|uniref:Uncharacterized protein n=1 Tax=Eumeta variegata TaxID=151549 RepID=A0A4C2ABE2_EUMVA|nr:hypothetical protein EVAR_50554_1 [Eumeta japonica]